MYLFVVQRIRIFICFMRVLRFFMPLTSKSKTQTTSCVLFLFFLFLFLALMYWICATAKTGSAAEEALGFELRG